MLKLKNKLNSETGASLLIALLFFIISAMVSVVIVSAASTAVKRLQNDNTVEQEMLSINSGARLIEEQIENVSCSRIEVEVYEDGVYKETLTSYTADVSSPLSVCFKKCISRIDSFEADQLSSKITLTHPDIEGSHILENVYFQFLMIYDEGDVSESSKYSITGTIGYGDASIKRQVYFNAKATQSESVDPDAVTFINNPETGISIRHVERKKVTTYTWENVNLSTKGSDVE